MGNRMGKITKRTVDALIASGSSKPMRDDDVRGFGARLNADRSVSYFVEFRAGRGRAFPVRRIVLGRHGALTPEQAREMAKKNLARVLSGADPAAERTASRKEMTVGDLLHHALATHWEPKKKASTAKNFRGMIERSLIPEFGAIETFRAEACSGPRLAFAPDPSDTAGQPRSRNSAQSAFDRACGRPGRM